MQMIAFTDGWLELSSLVLRQVKQCCLTQTLRLTTAGEEADPITVDN